MHGSTEKVKNMLQEKRIVSRQDISTDESGEDGVGEVVLIWREDEDLTERW